MSVLCGLCASLKIVILKTIHFKIFLITIYLLLFVFPARSSEFGNMWPSVNVYKFVHRQTLPFLLPLVSFHICEFKIYKYVNEIHYDKKL